MFKKIKAFILGFDYAVQKFDIIEDHHFHSLPNAEWHDRKLHQTYRKGIAIGLKYMQYRLEFLVLFLLLCTSFIFAITW